jgi:hypothetical protein
LIFVVRPNQRPHSIRPIAGKLIIAMSIVTAAQYHTTFLCCATGSSKIGGCYSFVIGDEMPFVYERPLCA